MIDLIYVFVPATALIVWFETNAFVEYCRALKVGLEFFGVKKYKRWEEKGLSYPEFLAINDNTFFNRLISCPVCLNFWLNLFFVLFHGNIYVFCAGYCISLLVYFLLKLIMVRGNSE